MSEPLIKADPVKALLRLIGVEQATPQEQQAEVAKPEPEGIEPLQQAEAQPVETLPARQETVEPLPAEPTPAFAPLPSTPLQPTLTTTTEAPLQPSPPRQAPSGLCMSPPY